MFKLPQFHIPEIQPIPDLPKFADISIAKIKEMSDEDLLKLLNGESDIDGIIPLSTQSAITSELLKRTIHKSTRPHWSVTPSFWLLIIGTSAACIAAYPVLFPPPQAQQSAVAVSPSVQTTTPESDKPSSSQPPSPNSPERKAAQQKR